MPELISIPDFENYTSNTSMPIFNAEPILNEINNVITISTPFINSFIHNSNSSVRLNSEQINNHLNTQINDFINNNLNPLLQSFRHFGDNR